MGDGVRLAGRTGELYLLARLSDKSGAVEKSSFNRAIS